MQHPLRLVALGFALALVSALPAAHADEMRDRINALEPAGMHKGLDEKPLAQKVEAMGDGVVPVIIQVVETDGENTVIQWMSPDTAMDILVHFKAKSAIPALKKLARTSRNGWGQDSLCAMLQIDDTPENRRFVIETLNEWIASYESGQDPHDVRAPLIGSFLSRQLPRAGLTPSEIVSLATATHIDGSAVKPEIFQDYFLEVFTDASAALVEAYARMSDANCALLKKDVDQAITDYEEQKVAVAREDQAYFQNNLTVEQWERNRLSELKEIDRALTRLRKTKAVLAALPAQPAAPQPAAPQPAPPQLRRTDAIRSASPSHRPSDRARGPSCRTGTSPCLRRP